MEKKETIRFYGDCLTALGIPDKGTAVIDREIEPEVFDIVFCDSSLGGALGGYLKQIIDTRKGHEIVGTKYADAQKNWIFHPAAIWGVVVEAKDVDGKTVYRRPEHREVREEIYARPVKFYNDPFSGRMFTTCSHCDGRIGPKDAYCKHCGANLHSKRRSVSNDQR